MSERRIGIVLIVGFVMLVVGAFVAPSGAYQGPIEDRLEVITSAEGQWLVSKIFDGSAVVLASVGMVMLAVLTRRNHGGWLAIASGASLALAGVVGLGWIYLLVTDPGPLYDRDTPAPIVVVFMTLLAIGLLTVGLHFLSSRYSRWVGLFSATVGVGVLVALVVIQVTGAGPETAFGLGSLMYLVILTIGVMLIRRSKVQQQLDHSQPQT